LNPDEETKHRVIEENIDTGGHVMQKRNFDRIAWKWGLRGG